MLFVIVLSGAIFIVVLIMSSSKTESIFDKVKGWAHCTMEKLPPNEKMQMARVAEAGKLLMQKKAQELVLEVGGGPCCRAMPVMAHQSSTSTSMLHTSARAINRQGHMVDQQSSSCRHAITGPQTR